MEFLFLIAVGLVAGLLAVVAFLAKHFLAGLVFLLFLAAALRVARHHWQSQALE